MWKFLIDFLMRFVFLAKKNNIAFIIMVALPISNYLISLSSGHRDIDLMMKDISAFWKNKSQFNRMIKLVCVSQRSDDLSFDPWWIQMRKDRSVPAEEEEKTGKTIPNVSCYFCRYCYCCSFIMDIDVNLKRTKMPTSNRFSLCRSPTPSTLSLTLIEQLERTSNDHVFRRWYLFCLFHVKQH